MNIHHWPYWALISMIISLKAAHAGYNQLLAAGVAGLAGCGLLWPRSRGGALVMALGLSLGALRVGLPCPPDAWRDLDGLSVDASGLVLGQVRGKQHSLTFRFQVERLEGRPELPGAQVWAVWHAPREQQPRPLSGERWRLRGRLKAPRGPDYPRGFDQRAWLARHGIAHELHGWERHDSLERLAPARGWGLRNLAWRLRTRLLDLLGEGLPARQHALLCGIVLGETQFLEPGDEECFRATGTSHLLAASGMNVALVVALVVWLGQLLGYGPGLTALPALFMAAFYALLAEASASVVRAAVMAAVSLTALAVGRISTVLHSLTLACLGCLLADPAYLQDLGFQMSVLAVLSLVWLEPGFAQRLSGLPEWLRRPLAGTLAATLGLLPWMVWNFQQWAPGTILANLAMAPVAELLLPLGLAQAGLQALAPILAFPLVALNRALLGYLLGCAELLAHWLGAGQIARPDACQTLGLVAVVGLVALWLYGHVSFRLLLAADLLLALLFSRPPGPTSLRLRLAAPQGTPLVWLSLPRGPEILLAPSQLSPAGLRMLRIHGSWPDQILDPETPGRARCCQVQLDRQPGSCRLAHGQARILLAWQKPPAQHRHEVDLLIASRRWVRCQLWLQPTRPWEIYSNGRSIRVRPWQEIP